MADHAEIAALRAEVEALRAELAAVRASQVAALALAAQGCACGTGMPCQVPAHQYRTATVMYPQNTWMAANAAAGGYAGHVIQIPVGAEMTYTARVPTAACAGGGIPQVWTVNA